MHPQCNPQFIRAPTIYPAPYSQWVNVLQPYALCQIHVVPEVGEFALQVPRRASM